jgi:hypothetical protein
MLTQAAGGGLPVPAGVWGGEHIRLVVTETGAEVEYDCAVGRVEGPLRRNPDGDFEAGGVHAFEEGGPRRLGDPAPAQHPVRYQGWTDGHHMRLTVTLSASGKEVGTFSLELGRPPLLEKCL